MKRRYEGRIRPAGESSDEDELSDYMSENSLKPEIKPYIRTINKEEAENERIFQLFLMGNPVDVATFLNDGFDINKRLKDNWTPLLLAASVGTPEVTALLIDHGADVNFHRDYYTPLMAAASCPKTTSTYENSLLVVRQLLKNKADVNAKTRKRETALMFAAVTGNCSIIKELLPYCDKCAEDNQGWTALFWAISGNNIDAVKLLLEEELPYDKFDVRGNLPVHYAKENGFADIIALLPNLTEDETTVTFKEFGYQDFFDHGRSCFLQDLVTILYGMKNEKYIQHFLNKEVNLFNFLTLNEDDLKNIGVKMPYERYQILNGLYRLHKHPFKTKALPIVGKSESYSTLNVANSLLSTTRQFILMQGSLRYSHMNLQNPNELKDFAKEIQKIKESLNKIRLVVDKISVKALEWDYETAPADLITKQSCKKLKLSKLKYYFTISVLSISVYAMCKKFKCFHILS